MNLRLRFLWALLLMLSSAPLAQATHLLGGDLTYQYIGSGTPYVNTAAGYYGIPTQRYRLILTSYRDCGGISIEPSYQITARSSGCNTAAGINILATVSRVGPSAFGSPYCPTWSNQTTCTSSSPTARTNFEYAVFQGVIDLPLIASEWVLSASMAGRPSIANIIGNPDMYWETRLTNTVPASGALQPVLNASARFASDAVMFVGWNKSTFVNLGAYDPDGDSLSFSLVNSLTSCNTPVAYASLPVIPTAMGDTLIYINGVPTIIPIIAQIPNLPNAYSPTFPLPSFSLGGVFPAKTLTPYFAFDQTSGNLAFTPTYYDATAPWYLGKNRYAVAIQVQEWRRINGGPRLVGTTRREMLFIVTDCGPNQNPTFAPTIQTGGSTYPLSQTITAPRGITTTALLQAADADAAQTLTLSGNAANVPGATIRPLGSNQVAVDFTPPASLPDGTYFVTVTATDDACPVKGYTTRTVAFRVSSGALAARTATRLAATAYPNPFTDQVRFTLPRPTDGAEAVLIVDQFGRVVERLAVPAGAAGTEAAVTWRPAATTPAGVYLARFENGQQTVRLLRTQP